MYQAPWTDIGRLQQDIDSLKREVDRKVEGYEIHEINRKLDSLEHSLWEIRSLLDGIEYRMQTCEDKFNSE